MERKRVRGSKREKASLNKDVYRKRLLVYGKAHISGN